MGKVLFFTGITRLDLPVDTVLEMARGELESVIVIGWDKKGQQYFASTIADGGEVLWLLEHCKKALLEVGHGLP